LPPSLQEAILGLLLITGLGALGVKVRAIDFGGFVSGIIIGFLILIGGGWSWLAVILLFFVLSTQFTRYKYAYKRSIGVAQEKGGTRGWPNTVANGAVASLAAVAELFYSGSLFASAYLGAVASATADTLSTELGLLSRTQPRLITKPLRRVSAGTSGAVSLLGEAVAIASCVLIGAASSLLGILQIPLDRTIIIAITGGLVGTTIDSLLGATVQGIHKCQVCGQLTENLSHHNTATMRVKGFRRMDNNVVNFISTGAGALAGYLLMLRF